METHFTLGGMAAMFATMLVLAAIPSVSVLAVAARSAANGFGHGVSTTLGIVAGDVVLIVLAVYGLAALADLLGGGFVVVKYLAAAYLVWLGIALWRSRPAAERVDNGRGASLPSSFLLGLFITLGDQKAILFYLGFLPAFVDLPKLSWLDIGIIVSIAAVAIIVPKLLYAWLADRTGAMLQRSGAVSVMNALAGAVVIGIGVLLIVRA